MMMNGMPWGGRAGMGILWLLVIVVLMLLGAAAIKSYLFSTTRLRGSSDHSRRCRAPHHSASAERPTRTGRTSSSTQPRNGAEIDPVETGVVASLDRMSFQGSQDELRHFWRIVGQRQVKGLHE